MDASKGLRAVTLTAVAILGATVLACTDPGAGAAPSAEAPAPVVASQGPSADPSLDSPAPAAESAAPSAPSGPDDYGY